VNIVEFSKRLALLVCAALLSSSNLAIAQAGSLDPSFGDNGIVTTPHTATGCGQVVNCSIAIQSDGKIVVAGGATASDGGQEQALARYNTDGSLDSTFGKGGIVTLAENNGGPAFGVAIQTDGKIVTAAPGNLELAVFRFNTDGALDTTFGSGGVAEIGAAGLFIGPTGGSVAVLSDGKILVATSGQLGVGGTLMVRLLSDGQLDSSFGTGGVAPTLGTGSMVVLASGKVLGLGAFGAVRYDSDGSLDTTFGVDGLSPTFGGAAAVVPLSNGKFISASSVATGAPAAVGDSVPQGFIVVRYNSNGTIDTTFGTRGAVVTSFHGESFSSAVALAVQSDGDIVAAGVTEAKNPGLGQQPSDFALARYTPNGQLDTTFGSDGLVTTAFGTNGGDSAAISAMAIQADGKIVVAGFANANKEGSLNNGFVLARYLAQ
jgi:uncharacterized delta-60 repeat protein